MRTQAPFWGPTLSCDPEHTACPLGCLCTAKLSPVLESVCWSLSFNTQLLHTRVGAHLELGVQQGSQDLLCWSLSILLLQVGCCTLLWATEVPYLSWLISQLVKGVPRVTELYSFTTSSQDCRFHPNCFCCCCLALPGYVVIFLGALVVWDLPVFNRHFVKIFPCIDVFLVFL